MNDIDIDPAHYGLDQDDGADQDDAPPTPPDDLDGAALKLWRDVTEEIDLAAAELIVLADVCRAVTQVAEAQRLIDEHGLLIADRFGGLKENPAVGIQNRARSFIASSTKLLRLQIDPLPGPAGGRPFLRGRRR